MGRLEFDVLGPLAVRRDGRPVPLGEGKRALLLALLLLEHGRQVPRDRLIDELWGERPPETAVTALHGLVSQLRRLLGDEAHAGDWQVLVGRGSGYGIAVERGAIDTERSAAHLAAAREARAGGNPARALSEIDAALALWAGHPLLGLSGPTIDAFAEQWEGARLDALEDRAETLLELDRPRDALTEAEQLIDLHPLRERLRAAQVIALYRCGRQVEALAALGSARRRLRDDLGLAPSPVLDDLERRILNHDPLLGAIERPAAARSSRRGAARAGAIALAVAAVVAAGVLAYSARRDRPAPGGSAVTGRAVAIDAVSGGIRASYAVGAGAVGVASDAGAVWTLNAEDGTVTRIDLHTRVTRTIGTGTTPVDLAAGRGALWVADGSRTDAQFVGPVVTAVSKLDAATGSTLVTTGLAQRGAITSNTTRQHILATGDGIFVIGADYAVSRLDARSGAITSRTTDVRATAIAAGPLGLWALEPAGLVHIDRTSGRVLGRVPLASPNLDRLAVGAHSVWVTDSAAGVLWRIDPEGVQPTARTIAVEPGIDALALAGGSVWVANPERSRLIRIDPARNAVAQRVDLAGPPLGLTAAGSLIWVTLGTAPAPPAGDQLGTSCGPVIYGGSGRPDTVIVSDLPLGAGPRVPARQMADAIAFVLRSRHYRAGDRTVGYRSCDDWSAASAVFDPAKCRANAEAYGRSPSLLAVIGPYNSGCALTLIPAANAAAGGALAVISPTASSTDLTRSGVTTPSGLPGSLYPSRVRSFVRLLPTDDAEGAALAREAKALGARRVEVLTGGSFGETTSRAFLRAAARLGLQIAGTAVYDPGAAGYAALARKVERDSPDAVFVSGLLDENAGAVIRALRARLGHGIELIGSTGLLPVSALFKRAGPAARGVHVSIPGLEVAHLGPGGRAFVRAFGASRGGPVEQAAIYAAAAAELALDAIARSDGTRRGVLAELHRTRSSQILGPLRFDRNGDVSPGSFTIVRAVRPGGSDALQSVDGARWERIVAE
ncbi:MAG: hypothetical protein QOK36_1113 [Gaiellales bacterium]|nr:hypothetical protein [Gaiellales bacterium]